MRRLFALALCLMMIFTLAGCGTFVVLIPKEPKTAAEPAPQPVSEPQPAPEKPEADVSVAEEKVPEPEVKYPVFDPVKGVVPGTLYQINLEEGQVPVVKGITLEGNVAGTAALTGKDFSSENLRCAFEIGEWINIRIDTDLKADDFSAYYEEGLFAFIVPHMSDYSIINLEYMIDITGGPSTPSAICRQDDGKVAADKYIPSEYQPGFFDLIFTYKAKPVAMVMLMGCAEGSLSQMTDRQLEEFMAQAVAAAKNI